MKSKTTLTVTKKSKRDYDEIRKKANDAFIEKFAVPVAFKQVDFFDVVIEFIKANEDDFLDFLSNPTDSAFWRKS